MANINKRQIKITFLGTGANGGVPQVDCRCKNCMSKSLVRKRSSILVETLNEKIIIDSGPDFNIQLLENGLRITDLDAIVLSHLHWDHCSGLTELSSGKKLEIPLIVSDKTMKELKKHQFFSFLFTNGWASFGKKLKSVKIKFIKISHDPDFNTFAIKITGKNKSILVATDIASFNRKVLNEAAKSNLIIFDGTFLNENKHFHISIKESSRILSRLKIPVIYTHINHSEDSIKIKKQIVRFGFQIARDNLVIKI